MPNSPIIGKQDFQDSNHNLVFSVDPDSFLAQITMKALAVFETMVGNSALLNGTVGELLLGGNNETGKIALANGKKQNVMQLVSGQAWLGGGGATGLLTLFPPGVDNVTDTGKATMFLDGKVGDVVVGGSGQDGDIFLRDGSGKTQMHLIGGRAWLGGGGATGLLTLFLPAWTMSPTPERRASFWMATPATSCCKMPIAPRISISPTRKRPSPAVSWSSTSKAGSGRAASPMIGPSSAFFRARENAVPVSFWIEGRPTTRALPWPWWARSIARWTRPTTRSASEICSPRRRPRDTP
jgi:hypothetical protein